MSKAEDAAIRKYPIFLEYYPKIPSSTCGPDGFTPIVKDHNAYARQLFQEGYEQAEKDLGWHSVVESLPPVDEEVIVLRDELNDCLLPDASFVGVGHIVDRMHCSDYNGWNVPGVKYWMPMPKLPKD